MARKGQRWKSPRYKHKTAPRPRKLFKCHFYKPPRKWTVKAVARAACASFSYGGTHRQLDRAIEIECGDPKPVECDCERIAVTLRRVLELEQFAFVALSVLTALSTVLSVVLVRRIPLIGSLLARAVTDRAVQRITSQGQTIEGTFFRVREELFLIERQLAREVLPRA